MAEVVGSGSAHMRIQYCGGWGYRPKCTQVIEALDAQKPNTYTYHLVRDAGRTGNFECSVYDNAELSGDAKDVYSKQKTGQFPFASEEEWDLFMGALWDWSKNS